MLMLLPMAAVVVVSDFRGIQTMPTAEAAHARVRQGRPLPVLEIGERTQQSADQGFVASARRSCISSGKCMYTSQTNHGHVIHSPSRCHRPAALFRIFTHLGPLNQRALLTWLSAATSGLLPSTFQASRRRGDSFFCSRERGRRCRTESVVHGHRSRLRLDPLGPES